MIYVILEKVKGGFNIDIKYFPADKKKFRGFYYIIYLLSTLQLKIGYTNDIHRRMKEHAKYYNSPIDVIWVSPELSESTARRLEFETRENLKNYFPFINNDRFTLPAECFNQIKTFELKIRKKYLIQFNIIDTFYPNKRQKVKPKLFWTKKSKENTTIY